LSSSASVAALFLKEVCLAVSMAGGSLPVSSAYSNSAVWYMSMEQVVTRRQASCIPDPYLLIVTAWLR